MMVDVEGATTEEETEKDQLIEEQKEAQICFTGKKRRTMNRKMMRQQDIQSQQKR